MHSNCWNPLAEMVKKMKAQDHVGAKEAIDDLFSITNPSNQNLQDPYWSNCARSLGSALIELIMACGEDEEINFLGIYQLLEDMSVNDSGYSGILAQTLELMQEESLLKRNILASAKNAERTFACISSETKSGISIFTQNKAILNMVSQNDFFIEDCLKKKTLVYMITPDEKTTYNSLVSLFVKQSYEIITAYAQNSAEGRLATRMNYVLEEFGNLPKIPDLVAMLSAGRGRNIRFMICMQDMGAIRYKYQDILSTILGNLTDLVFLFSRENALLSYLTNLCGNRADGTPLVSTSLLQQMDKARGEALLLVDRKKPYITTLPDIDEYDFEILPQYPLPLTPKKEIRAFRITDAKECARLLDEYERMGESGETISKEVQRFKLYKTLINEEWKPQQDVKMKPSAWENMLKEWSHKILEMDMEILPEALNDKTLNLPTVIHYPDAQNNIRLDVAVERIIAKFRSWLNANDEITNEAMISICDLTKYCIYYICLAFKPEYADIFFVYKMVEIKLRNPEFFTVIALDLQNMPGYKQLQRFERKYQNGLKVSEIELITATKKQLKLYIDNMCDPAKLTSKRNWMNKMELDCKQYKNVV